MSIQAVAAVLEAEVGEVAAKMLLICIANAHNTSTGRCCPSIDRLAKESGMGRSTVKRWLKWLEDHRLLEVEETFAKDGRQQAHQYRLILGEGSKLDRVQIGPGEGFTSEPGEGSNCEPPLKEPEEIPESPTPRTDASPRALERNTERRISAYVRRGISRDRAMQVPCSRCGAFSHSPCSGHKGAKRQQPHIERYQKAAEHMEASLGLGRADKAPLVGTVAQKIADGSHVNVIREAEPKVYARCIEAMGANWRAKADWKAAAFPADVVRRARAELVATAPPGGGLELSAARGDRRGEERV